MVSAETRHSSTHTAPIAINHIYIRPFFSIAKHDMEIRSTHYSAFDARKFQKPTQYMHPIYASIHNIYIDAHTPSTQNNPIGGAAVYISCISVFRISMWRAALESNCRFLLQRQCSSNTVFFCSIRFVCVACAGGANM